MTLVLEYVQARSHGGAMPGGRPRILVIHDAETPLRRGYADSIARNWFATKATTSAHVMVDPGKAVRMLPDSTIAWHCGTGNTRSKGYEQAGYARFTRAEWLSPDGLSQMRLLAALLAEDCRKYGIPARWANDEQIRDAHYGGAPAGLATHDDMRRALGGTSHTDPGRNYPRDRLLAMVKEALAGKVVTPTPPKPAPKPVQPTQPSPWKDDTVTPFSVKLAGTTNKQQSYAYCCPDGVVCGPMPDGAAGVGAFRNFYEGKLANPAQVVIIQRYRRAAEGADVDVNVQVQIPEDLVKQAASPSTSEVQA